ncbi:helix-turn-helix domain-containing protein [Roseospira navarrensis]|uniref:histidine kinase n=1 Tax=Roseospira navarrensis TaxID=140058 RepID=A0A7X1ZFD4_9PROT|nr:short-chain fatty acyl-CoA regulator family protein [Roseospira navarrensis]MQX36392.1 helix-turn-helix domain-containing protein [Roseospira navarrensis]
MESGFGLKIRERRRSMGLTQANVADAVGISTSYFNLIERGKRTIGGALLLRIAEALELDPATLDDDAERRLVAEITEVVGDPLVAGLDLRPGDVAALVGRHPDWARALAMLHRECRDRGELVAALSDRLHQDPFLADIVHRMLTNIAGIRSTAEILESVDDIEPGQSQRFHATLVAESSRLSEAAQALADFFDHAEAPKQAVTPGEELDDFIQAHGNHFPPLEEGAARLRARIGANGPSGETAVAGYLETRASSRAARAAPGDGPGDALAWALEDGAPPASRRFALARLAVGRDLAEPIAAIVEASPLLSSEAARRRAEDVLASYAAAALLMPYERFLEDAERLRYDIGLVRRIYQASVEQVCQRFVSLRRPGAEGVAFAMVRSDPAGNLSKPFPLPRLPMPRQGAACSLWAVYRAFQSPGAVVRHVSETPSGDRFLFFAQTVAKGVDRFGAPPRQASVMLACDLRVADRVVYGDGLDLSANARPDPVGVSCRVCPRDDCAHRAAAPIVPLA